MLVESSIVFWFLWHTTLSLFLSLKGLKSRTLFVVFEEFHVELFCLFNNNNNKGSNSNKRRRTMGTTVHRFLLALQNEAAGGGESVLQSIKVAVLPIAKVFTMCFLGFLMASKYVNILPASGRKLLNGVCVVHLWICLCIYIMYMLLKWNCSFFLCLWLTQLLVVVACVYTVATLLDILPIGTSCYLGEDARMVGDN